MNRSIRLALVDGRAKFHEHRLRQKRAKMIGTAASKRERKRQETTQIVGWPEDAAEARARTKSRPSLHRRPSLLGDIESSLSRAAYVPEQWVVHTHGVLGALRCALSQRDARAFVWLHGRGGLRNALSPTLAIIFFASPAVCNVAFQAFNCRRFPIDLDSSPVELSLIHI